MGTYPPLSDPKRAHAEHVNTCGSCEVKIEEAQLNISLHSIEC